MKNAIYFILGICLVVLTSASTISIMTVKPAKPKSVLVTYGRAYNIKRTACEYIKNGYQIKVIQGTHYSNEIMLVMEKY